MSHQHANNEANIIGGIENSESLKYGLKNVIDQSDIVPNKLNNQIAQGISVLPSITGNGVSNDATVPVHNFTRYKNGHLANDVTIIDMEAGMSL